MKPELLRDAAALTTEMSGMNLRVNFQETMKT